ncbi:hypothetical protein [Methanosalsum natronophilum]|nr:hypothetical protein [Methanosalsum natronophilum]
MMLGLLYAFQNMLGHQQWLYLGDSTRVQEGIRFLLFEDLMAVKGTLPY